MNASGYAAPSSLDQAVQLLSGQTRARLLAGGQNLLLQAHRTGIDGVILIDLGKVKDLSGIALQPDGGLQIGAMTTLDARVQDQVVSTQYPALAEGVAWIGDAQLRNRATVGGSLADADPESDLAARFLALAATVHIRNAAGSRAVPMNEFFSGVGTTALAQSDIITAITLPAAANGSGMAYQRMKHPATLYALCGVAAQVARAVSGEITLVRVGATGALTFPARLETVEKALLGQHANANAIVAAVSSLPDTLAFRSDLFGSGPYRRNLLQVLTRRALTGALSLSA